MAKEKYRFGRMKRGTDLGARLGIGSAAAGAAAAHHPKCRFGRGGGGYVAMCLACLSRGSMQHQTEGAHSPRRKQQTLSCVGTCLGKPAASSQLRLNVPCLLERGTNSRASTHRWPRFWQ
eukprot:1129043-Rhodomonas_salina.1